MIPAEVVLTLLEVPGLGSRKAHAILSSFPGISDWQELLACDISRVEGISNALAHRLRETPIEIGQRILERTESLGGRYLHYWQPGYPKMLSQIYDPPVGLFLRGQGDLEAEFIAVVGTRQPTPYGREQARHLTHEVISVGLGITSGFARGIDTVAHTAAMEVRGRTVAVLGCGIDIVYPAENRKLYSSLLEKGLAVSEYPPGAKPDGHHFPQRNRIISGLSLGVLVVEAGTGSGALITALHALDLDRQVFAVPGRIDNKKSTGCHELINRGAKLVGRVEDILSELGAPYSAAPGDQLDLIRDLPEPERGILEYLSREPVPVDQIAEDLNRDISELLAILLFMEMNGLVIQTAGKRFSRA